MGWRIVDWQKFETTGDKRNTRKFYGGLDYLQLPVKLSGDKYEELMGWRNGPISFAVWVAILEAWATQDRARRKGGILWSWCEDRQSTEIDLAKKTHIPEKLIKLALANLIKIGWLEEIQCKSDGNPPEIQRKSAGNPHRDLDLDLNKDIDKDLTPILVSKQTTTEAAVEKIFEHWNSKKQSGNVWKGHRELTKDKKDAIKASLQENFSPEQICQAIDNYALVLLDDRYKWTYAWSLYEFLTRRDGTTSKDPRKWWQFLPDNFGTGERYLIPPDRKQIEKQQLIAEAMEMLSNDKQRSR